MGADAGHGYAEDGETPVHEVELPAFGMGATTVTNAEFAEFVDATGHVTTAERFGTSFVFGGLLPDDFTPSRGVAAAPWWREVERADRRHPQGPHSDVSDRLSHPVVHVSWFDALTYAAWAGARLPTEAAWERAARGGRPDGPFPWGWDREPGGEHRMTVFQGQFPRWDSGEDGWVRTCPVGAYPPNDYGLYEVTGNVWECCADWFDPTYHARSPRRSPRGPEQGQVRAMRGGSYLCHDSYCRRYRVDARAASTPDSSAGNIGRRIVSPPMRARRGGHTARVPTARACR